MNRFQQNKREQLKEKCLNYLGGKICSKCRNRSLPICCYDFHHHRGSKETEISKLIQSEKTLTEKLKKELDKCKILCANCHREINYFHIKI